MSTSEIELALVVEDEYESREDLRKKFFRYHKFKDERGNFNICRPIFYGSHPCRDDCYIVLYHRSYFVTIEQGNSPLVGPHKAQLFFKAEDNETHWLGTRQIAGSFYDRKRIRKQLRRAIRERDYFCSEKDLKEEILIRKGREFISEVLEIGPPPKLKKILRKRHSIFLSPKATVCNVCKAKRKTHGKLVRHLFLKHPQYRIWHKVQSYSS
jgi:hypothetical protein